MRKAITNFCQAIRKFFLFLIVLVKIKFMQKPINKGRRSFIQKAGLFLGGLLTFSSGLLNPFKSRASNPGYNPTTKVAVTLADSYGSDYIKEKVRHLFDSLGGLSEIVEPGDKVGIKINLTGGSGFDGHPNLQGVDPREAMWTHPDVFKAVGDLLIEKGVSGSDIYVVEAIWDMDSYNLYGYSDIQQSWGAKLVNLNNPDPYDDFEDVSTGPDYFYYPTIKLNRILSELDLFVSIPKMKQHYDAALTHSMKNLVGIVPMQYYMMPDAQGWRSKLHFEGGPVGQHLPRSVCDINLARPVQLAVIDGIKNAVGGEGPWNPTFEPAEFGMLIAGTDPVATDSVAVKVMGFNPEDEQIQRPAGEYADNHLYLMNQKGHGTNKMDDIELVGDGAGSVLGIGDHFSNANLLELKTNAPNPFRFKTTIEFSIPESSATSLRILDNKGKLVKTIVQEKLAKGTHSYSWNAKNAVKGIYYCRLQACGYSRIIKMLVQ